jgi:ATP/maltotriose-dependent transcriptional regulator MalT
VAEICRRLDGLPLAIELAAARVRHFPPEALLTRLKRRLPLLSDGPRDAPAHQRTLAATIDWSYGLLEEPERRTLRAISVFAGGCTVDGAQCVAGAGEPSLLTLVDHSLLRRIEASPGEPRFAMLDTVREFALDRLAEAGEWEETRRRHAAWCLELLAPAEAALGTATQQQFLRPLETEHANLRAAMEMAKAADDGEVLARLAGGLWSFWYARGFLTEGRAWLADALAMVGDRPELHLKLVLGSGALAHAQGDDDRATDALQRALDLAREAEDPRARSMSLTMLGAIARDRGDFEQAGSLLGQGLSTAEAAGDAWAIGMALNTLAVLHERRGDYERAAEVLKRSLELAEAANDVWGTVQAITNMAHLEHRQGEIERAASLYEHSARLYREIGERRGEANALTNLGRLAERLGELDRAVDLHSRSLAITRELGDRRGTGTALANRGVAHLRRGDLGHAEEDLRQSLEIRFRSGDREGIATCLEKLAEVTIARGRAARAIRLWATAAALRDAIGAPLATSERASYDVVMGAARTMLGEDEAARLWAAGREEAVDDVVREALRDAPATEPALAVARTPARTDTGIMSTLTPRELEVLRLLEEHTDRAIADALSIGPRTVATHVTNILNKLGVNTRTAAVATAIRHGVI